MYSNITADQMVKSSLILSYPFPMILTQATKARNSLWLLFFVMGVVYMAWIPRIPEIKPLMG
jgi:hypothetical protein